MTLFIIINFFVVLIYAFTIGFFIYTDDKVLQKIGIGYTLYVVFIGLPVLLFFTKVNAVA